MTVAFRATLAYARRVEEAVDTARDGMSEDDRDRLVSLLDEIEAAYGPEEREAVEAGVTSNIMASVEAQA